MRVFGRTNSEKDEHNVTLKIHDSSIMDINIEINYEKYFMTLY